MYIVMKQAETVRPRVGSRVTRLMRIDHGFR